MLFDRIAHPSCGLGRTACSAARLGPGRAPGGTCPKEGLEAKGELSGGGWAYEYVPDHSLLRVDVTGELVQRGCVLGQWLLREGEGNHDEVVVSEWIVLDQA